MTRIVDNNGSVIARGTLAQMLAFARKQITFDPSWPVWIERQDRATGYWYTVKRFY